MRYLSCTLKRRVTAILVAVVLLGSLVAVPRVFAHVFKARPRISVDRVPDGAVNQKERVVIFGRLQTARTICRQDRVVRLLRARPGRDSLIATDTTDAEGEYLLILRPRRSMTIYTVVARSLKTSYGHSHDCARARSTNLRIRVD